MAPANRSGADISVEPVWAEGIQGQGVNIAVVDDGMYFAHEDLRDNVNTSSITTTRAWAASSIHLCTMAHT